MKNIQSIEFYTGSKEELLPGFASDFPYIASRAELDKYTGRYVPWHWHKTVELFYMESGSLEYDTPGGKLLFPAGSGGMKESPGEIAGSESSCLLEECFRLVAIGEIGG